MLSLIVLANNNYRCDYTLYMQLSLLSIMYHRKLIIWMCCQSSMHKWKAFFGLLWSSRQYGINVSRKVHLMGAGAEHLEHSLLMTILAPRRKLELTVPVPTERPYSLHPWFDRHSRARQDLDSDRSHSTLEKNSSRGAHRRYKDRCRNRQYSWQ